MTLIIHTYKFGVNVVQALALSFRNPNFWMSGPPEQKEKEGTPDRLSSREKYSLNSLP